VILAARTILALQTIVSRELPPLDLGIITVASIHGGTTYNAIPDDVSLQVNIRYFKKTVRDQIIDSIQRITRNVALSAGIPEDRMPEVRILPHSVPPLINDPSMTMRVVGALKRYLGDDHLLRIEPLTGSEDFGVFGLQEQKIPLCYFRVGTGTSDGAFLHNSRFSPPPADTISQGVFCMTIAALELLGNDLKS